MADVISLDNKLQQSKDKQAATIRKRKLLAARKILQCTQCALKCEKCGMQITPARARPTGPERDMRGPYRLCEGCRDEYLDYIDRLKGGGNPDNYWHNQAWMEMWQRWIHYQSATDSYLKSKEFIQLIKDLKYTRPDK